MSEIATVEKRRVSVEISDEIYRKFRKICIDEDKSVTDILKELIQRFVDEKAS